ncbi:MotA/TolQ/ExbB proton channel family protein [Chitinivibrio alkaliphilus]|uniref:MotA/TolQ/ExbB proton channel family protein n=1 Tax=Chitinivibrio alkaliphilus ACht1 TaxID=1313304 RepID=U7D7A5_9BACT|nr:MotA/TolQ/ExbB proton channel family protein [Chitinivibrio alkaliphilus]ERP31451.1 MotA/TolQ/ExbB proton channel family protein [Chitinivibrio alkaliphilus ACht1]
MRFIELFYDYYVHTAGVVSLLIFFVSLVIFFLSFDTLFYYMHVEKNLPTPEKIKEYLQRKEHGSDTQLPPWFTLSFMDMDSYERDARSSRQFFINRYREVLLREVPLLEKNLDIIAAWVTVAPLLGLLGTVVGMVQTFSLITEHGIGNPHILSGGISIALLTTQTGLLIAFPGMLIHNYLKGRKERIVHTLIHAGEAIITMGEEHV